MRRQIFPALLGIVGCAILISLGVWQIHRLAWKEQLLAEIAAQIGAAPQPLPAPGTVEGNPDAWRFVPVALSGRTTGEEILVVSGMVGGGAGYQVIAAFETRDGRRVMLDRGFLPEDARDAPRPPVPLTLQGNLHWPREADSYTPPPDVARRIWFARDVTSMAAALDTERLLVVAGETGGDGQGITPVPIDTSGIPNDHMQYAITWFSLALVWAGMTGLWMWRITRRGS